MSLCCIAFCVQCSSMEFMVLFFTFWPRKLAFWYSHCRHGAILHENQLLQSMVEKQNQTFLKVCMDFLGVQRGHFDVFMFIFNNYARVCFESSFKNCSSQMALMLMIRPSYWSYRFPGTRRVTVPYVLRPTQRILSYLAQNVLRWRKTPIKSVWCYTHTSAS